MKIGSVSLGDGAPLVLIGGLNVLEDLDGALASARRIADAAARHDIPLVFKASFDKANRTRLDSFRGPGLETGLAWLDEIKRATGLPLLTDVHEPAQAEAAAGVVDGLQVPAFLCRQTDLLTACGRTGLPVNLKKGQFVAPADLRHGVDKIRSQGSGGVFVTERGTSFGYHELVADLRSLVTLREFAPVCFDATHAVQRPGREEGSSGGDRRLVAPLARAAVAVGIDALFVEAHPSPETAPCDGPGQISFAALEHLVAEVTAIEAALRPLRSARPSEPGR